MKQVYLCIINKINKFKMKKLFLIISIITLTLNSCETPSSNQDIPKKPKNIVLMIGDGMGVTQISAGMYSQEAPLNLEQFPIVGLHKSYAYNDLVTDSAAGATAFACGVKTYNGAVGVDKDTMPVSSILEIADKRGIATGMVSTSSITHATPASFICHQKKRKQHQANALEFLNTDIDLFVGGGKAHFENRDDGINISDKLVEKGYHVSSYFKEDILKITMNPEKPYAFYTDSEEPVAVSGGRNYLPSVSAKSVDFLDKRGENGFFLMIEGSQIDWGGHANQSDYIITEMHDFDKAIGNVLEFAKKDGETLVIVTADHETGGYAINKGSTRDSLVTAFTTDYHTADLIPVFAYGPGSEAFSGIYENTAIFDKMMNALGLKRN